MPREFITFGLQNNDYFSSGQCLAQKKLTGRMSLEKCVRMGGIRLAASDDKIDPFSTDNYQKNVV